MSIKAPGCVKTKDDIPCYSCHDCTTIPHMVVPSAEHRAEQLAEKFIEQRKMELNGGEIEGPEVELDDNDPTDYDLAFSKDCDSCFEIMDEDLESLIRDAYLQGVTDLLKSQKQGEVR